MADWARKGLKLLAGSAFLLAFPQSAVAQPALGGTDWEADPDCIFDYLHFYADGTSKMITFMNDPHDSSRGGEMRLPGTWAFDGAKLTVKFDSLPDESLVGTFDGSDLKVAYTWLDKDNAAHVDHCTLTANTNS